MNTSPPIYFPPRGSSTPPLFIPRRQASSVSDAEAAAEYDRSLRQLEARLEQQERDLAERELRIAERERDLAETDALLNAREKVIEAARVARVQHPVPPSTPEERAALEALRQELDRQEITLREQKAAMTEREAFVEQNESRLFAKMQEQQERETEIEQRAEDLAELEQRIRSMDPDAPVVTLPETPSFPLDEFRE